jgi:hypothetical protein
MRIKKFSNSKILDEDAQCSLVTEIDFDIDNKIPIDFCFLLLFYKGEKVYEVIKYDGAHGKCHVHKYFEKKNSEGEECLPSQIDNKALITFKTDISDNWEEYINKYKKKWKL